LTKTPSVHRLDAGDQLTWTLQAANTGPSDAAGPITIVDTLPPHQSYLSNSTPWVCTAAPLHPKPASSQTVTCQIPTGLAAGASAPLLEIVVQVAQNTPSAIYVNHATASSPTPGDHPTARGVVQVGRVVELSITKRHSGMGVVGEPLAFRIVAHNGGPSAADQLVVTDPLPTGLTYKSATGTGWTCTNAAAVITCHYGRVLLAGHSAPAITLTVVVHAAAYKSVTNIANVSSTDPELKSTAMARDVVDVANPGKIRKWATT
jgi:large repetitive protein